jgi:xanthine dehydrogenase molybdopterin-binding subunit B
MPVAAAAALAATLFDAPVAYQLSRCADFAQNGGRCAGRLRYDVGYGDDGKVTAIKAEVRHVRIKRYIVTMRLVCYGLLLW